MIDCGMDAGWIGGGAVMQVIGTSPNLDMLAEENAGRIEVRLQRVKNRRVWRGRKV